MNLLIQDLTLERALKGYQKKEFKPSEIVAAYLRHIEATNQSLNSFLSLDPERSLEKAKTLDKQIDSAAVMPLFGIPIAVKDIILVTGWKTTASSKILENYTSPYTATCIERLEKAGAIVLGKTNCDEFAMGSSNENSAYGNVKNPWDTARVPGGSSGGAAAAMASSQCLGSIGTDTGGSIRQPASFCGVVGLKPTYGRVSRYGVIAFASSLDQVGPLTHTVWDTARMLEVMAGKDPCDATTSTQSVTQYTKNLVNAIPLKGKKIGIVSPWLEGCSPDVRSSYEASLEMLKSLGASLIEVALPHATYSLATYYIIASSECSSNLARFDGIHYGRRTRVAPSHLEGLADLYSTSRGEGFGSEVKSRIMLGTYALSSGYYDAFYKKASEVRKIIQQDFDLAFEKCDAIVTPTSPSTAFQFGEKSADPIQMYLSDVYTVPVNLAGLPALSVPSGIDSNGLPIGLQWIGQSFDEMTLLGLASQYENARGKFPRPNI